MQKTVFISYRRKDTAPAAGRFYDRLCHVLSTRHVFLDVSTIEGGKDFVAEVTAAIKNSDAVVVFIGSKWLEPTPEGVVRIMEPDDHVRAEVRAALQHTSMVLPVLVDGAQMPLPGQLPEDIRAISTKNAMFLRHESFDDDTENIITKLLGTSARERIWEDHGKPAAKLGYALAGLLAALIFLGCIGEVHKLMWGVGIAGSIGNEMTILLLISGAIWGAWMGLRYEARRRRRRLHGLA